MDEDKKKFMDKVLPKDLETAEQVETEQVNTEASAFAPAGFLGWAEDAAVLSTLDDTQTFSVASGRNRPISWHNVAFRTSSIIPVEQEREIERIVDRRLAENIPMFEKVMDSMMDRKLQSLNILDPYSLRYGLGTPNIIGFQPDIYAIEKIISDSFLQLPYVKQVSYVQHGDEWRLIVVHDSENHEEAFDKIEEKIIELEEKLPELDIEPWILHSSEVESRHLTNAKAILEK